MKKWNFENGVAVYEEEFDSDLHCLKVYKDDKYLGTVYPASIVEMNIAINALDEGEDPISGHWDDGCGNACTLDGWSENDWNPNEDEAGW